jgi:hypothetical protein
MQRWLAVAAALWLLAASGAQAQMNGLGAVEIAEVAKNHRLDLRIPQSSIDQRSIPLVQGMIVQRQLAPSATVGLGLGNFYARKRGGEFRLGDRPVRSRKPAVTFVLKF